MTIQKSVFSIVIITILIAILLVYVNHKLKTFDPLSKPTGIVLLVMTGTKMLDSLVVEKTNEKIASKLTPYLMSVIVYVFLSNIAGLFNLECPTCNFSVTLALALITVVLIEVYSFTSRGFVGYLKSWFEPLAPFVVMNVLSRLSTILSLSLRLFGNILAGTVLMSVIYQMLGNISSMIPLIGKLNVVGIVVAPVLHFYFDLFSGAMQAFIFVVLSASFIGKELPSKD